MSHRVLEGMWEKIVSHGDEFNGKLVRLTILEKESIPNEAMLAAYSDEIQKGMRLTVGEDSKALLREGEM